MEMAAASPHLSASDYNCAPAASGKETAREIPGFLMPIYEYRCESCGEQIEKLQRISDDPLRDCPACERPHLRKMVSAASFRLKGGGWYETDFKKDNKRNLAQSDSSSDKPGDNAKSASSEPKKDAGKTESSKKTEKTSA